MPKSKPKTVKVRCIETRIGRELKHPSGDRLVAEGDEVELDARLANYLIDRGDFEVASAKKKPTVDAAAPAPSEDTDK